jgi:hypothetical protein
MKVFKIALLCAILATIFLFLSLFLTWYNVDINYETAVEEKDYGLTGYNTRNTNEEGMTIESMSYDDLLKEEQSANSFEYKINELFDSQLYIVITTMIGLVIFTFMIFLALKKKGKGINYSIFFGVINLLLILLLTFQFIMGVDDVFHNGAGGDRNLGKAIDSFRGTNYDTTWGPGPGWYLSILSIPLLLVSIFMLFKTKFILMEWETFEYYSQNPGLIMDQHNISNSSIKETKVTEPLKTALYNCPKCREIYKIQSDDDVPEFFECPECKIQINKKVLKK